MSDDFVNMFTHPGSLKEDAIDISDDDEIEESFSNYDSKRKRRPTLQMHSKKLKHTGDSLNSVNSIDSGKSTTTTTASISIDDDENDDELSFIGSDNSKVNNNNNNNNNNVNNNNSNRTVYSLDDDDDDEVTLTAAPVYTKTPVLNFLKASQTSTLNSNSNNNNSNNSKINNDNDDIFSTPKRSLGIPNNNYYDSPSKTPGSYGGSPAPTKRLNDGIPLSIKCVGENLEKMIFYYDTPLQKLVDIYCSKKNLDANTVQFKLYGLLLDSSKTPRQLDLLDDDTLEVGIKISKQHLNTPEPTSLSLPSSLSSSSSTLSSQTAPIDDGTPKVLLQVRFEQTTHKFKIGLSDPFSKLIAALSKKITVPSDKKVVFKFDGAVLSPTATPEDEDMEDDFLIDAFLK